MGMRKRPKHEISKDKKLFNEQHEENKFLMAEQDSLFQNLNNLNKNITNMAHDTKKTVNSSAAGDRAPQMTFTDLKL